MGVILPGAFSVWNMIIARTYYQGVPRELREASDVDGASEMTFFFQILVPICMPLVAVLALWQFVAMWNSYFDAMIYLNDTAKQPLQLGAALHPDPEPARVRHDRRHPEHR